MLALAFLVCSAWAIAVLPAKLLLLEPDHRDFASESERISVALTRWVVVSSFAILTLWCILPGTNRAVPLTIRRANMRKPLSLIRTVKRARLARGDLVALRCFVLGGAMIAFTSLIGIVIRFPRPGLATLMSVVVFGSAGWLVWRVGLRLLRHRAPRRGPYSIWEYLWFPMMCAGLMTMIPLASDASIQLSKYLSLLGPLGWQMSQLRDLGSGHLLSLIPLSGFVITASFLGWLVARDARSWSHRRQLIESQRLLLAGPIEAPAASQSGEDTELSARIRRDLDAMMMGRRARSWRFWLAPAWLRRHARWYLVLAAMMIVFQAVLLPIHLFVSSADSVAVIGEPQVEPKVSLIAMMAAPLAIMLVAMEILALIDRIVATLNSVDQRPVSTAGFLFEVQRDGVLRLPIQLILLLPMLPLAWAAGAIRHSGYHLPLVAIGVLLIVRTFYATVTVLSSLRPIMPWWARMSSNGALMITWYVGCGAPLVFVILISQSKIDLSTVSSLLVAGNLMMAGIYVLVSWPRVRRAPVTV